jgi:hypothetical protein
MNKRILVTGLLFASTLISHAAIIITIEQVGNDVVATSNGGGLDLTGLTSPGNSFNVSHLNSSSNAIWIGNSGSVTLYGGYTLTGGFAGGVGDVGPDVNSGPLVGTYGTTAISLPFGYVSGTPLAISSSTWQNKTFADLGLSGGDTVLLSWGADSMTINVVPEPAMYGSLLGTFVLGASLLRRRRVKG